jgi:uncharacterized protein YjbI with pentapeptide repeats
MDILNRDGDVVARVDVPGHANGELISWNFMDMDLRGAIFDEFNLENAHFSGSNLVGASFVGADLYWAYFDDANAECADFRRADLEGADFTGDEPARCAF